jgi:hypothetical protein
MSNTKVAGYFGGGTSSGATYNATVDKFTFPSDTRSTLGVGLSSIRNRTTSFADGGV